MKPGKKRFFLNSGDIGVLLDRPDRVILLNTAAGEMLRLLRCKRGKGTVDAKQGTDSTEALGTLDGLDMHPRNCGGAYKAVDCSYFFGFQKALVDYERILQNNWQLYRVRSSWLYTGVQNIL